MEHKYCKNTGWELLEREGYFYNSAEKILIEYEYMQLGLIPPNISMYNALQNNPDALQYKRRYRKIFKKAYKHFHKYNNFHFKELYGLNTDLPTSYQLRARYFLVFNYITFKMKLDHNI